MLRRLPARPGALVPLACLLLICSFASADGNLKKVNHIIIVMQENHSFDNYFGRSRMRPAAHTTMAVQAARVRITSVSTASDAMSQQAYSLAPMRMSTMTAQSSTPSRRRCVV